MTGPNVFVAITPTKYSPGAEDSKFADSTGWPPAVRTYSRGGKLAQTAALRLAQVQAVDFSSASSSAEVGGRDRVDADVKVV